MKKAVFSFLLPVLPLLLLMLLLPGLASAEEGSPAWAGKEHPCILIETEGGQAILSRETYVPATVRVVNCDPAFTLTAEAGVRVRGNSTAEQGDEKPYRLKFGKKQNLLGLHGGRKYKNWVLLRSYWHLAPDYLGFRLAETIFGGKYYVSDCLFVNLYVNGEPRGVYVLCEQNQAAKERIWVNEPKEGDGRPETGYLLEMDNYPEEPYFWVPDEPRVTDIAGTTRSIPDRFYSIKSDTWSREQVDFITRWTRGAFRILFDAAVFGRASVFDDHWNVVAEEEGSLTPWEAVSAVMDPESLANMVILEELVQNYDVGMGSFFMAVDFTEDSRYPRLTFLAPWDFSWGFSEPAEGGYYAATFQRLQEMDWLDRSNPWYILAMKLEPFRALVAEKWRTLSRSGALEAAISRVEADCRAMAPDLAADAWKVDQGLALCDYVRRRILWLDGVWRGE